MIPERRFRQGNTASVLGPAAFLLGVCLMAVLASSLVSAAETPPSEYQVKAAYLLNFAKFVEWPVTAFASRDSALRICILGEDPFGRALDQLLEGEVINGRKLLAARMERPPQPGACQTLFISRSEKDVPAILSQVGPGVLTVSDRDGFLREGGMIAFVLDARRVRFDINLRAASGASLKISARLLNVARAVQK
jgi:hypothetical protein